MKRSESSTGRINIMSETMGLFGSLGRITRRTMARLFLDFWSGEASRILKLRKI